MVYSPSPIDQRAFDIDYGEGSPDDRLKLLAELALEADDDEKRRISAHVSSLLREKLANGEQVSFGEPDMVDFLESLQKLQAETPMTGKE